MDRALDVSPLDRVQSVLVDRPDVVLAHVFGSAAKDALCPDSDLDVAVLGVDAFGPEARSELRRALAIESGRPVDLVDLGDVGAPLLQQILTTGREIVCRDRRAKELLILRMLGDAEDFLPLRRRALEERRERWLGTS